MDKYDIASINCSHCNKKFDIEISDDDRVIAECPFCEKQSKVTPILYYELIVKPIF